ncbi:hypothetical protein VE00_03611 [Pseudogymnoascus sp. WSF 3629]|nr:hypothetical protein VE00_03611 [Pseudogymnoascus sp. WSF 3629]
MRDKYAAWSQLEATLRAEYQKASDSSSSQKATIADLEKRLREMTTEKDILAAAGVEAPITRATLDRGFNLSCAVLYDAMKTDGGFFQKMQDENLLNRIGTINKLMQPHHIFFLLSDQFKAVSFRFIFHDAIRPDPTEEKLRMDLRKYVRFTTAHLIYTTSSMLKRPQSSESG